MIPNINAGIVNDKKILISDENNGAKISYAFFCFDKKLINIIIRETQTIINAGDMIKNDTLLLLIIYPMIINIHDGIVNNNKILALDENNEDQYDSKYTANYNQEDRDSNCNDNTGTGCSYIGS